MKINYPEDFDLFTNAVVISAEKINQWIKEAVDYLESEPNEYSYYTASGNTIVIVFKHHEEYHIIVSDKYADCNVLIDTPINKSNDSLWVDYSKKEIKLNNKYLDKCVGEEIIIEFINGENLISRIDCIMDNYKIEEFPYENNMYQLIINDEIKMLYRSINVTQDCPDILQLIKYVGYNSEVNISFEDGRSFLKDESEDKVDETHEDFILEMINYLSTLDCEDCPMNPNCEFETCKYSHHCPFDKVAEILSDKF